MAAKYQQKKKVQNITRIYALSKRNVILRYKNSLVGFFWGFFKPFLYLLIFIVIFMQSASIPNYVLFASSGLILWFFFSNVVAQSIGVIYSSSGLIKSLDIPVIFFPLSEMLSELFNLLMTVLIFAIIMHWFGIVYSFKLLLIFPCILLFALFSFGLTLLLSSINVFFRDIGIIWVTVQPALFYMTPIGYQEKLVPEKFRVLFSFNPVYHFIKLGRNIFYDPAGPTSHQWNICIILATAMYIVGHFVFNKLKNQFISAI